MHAMLKYVDLLGETDRLPTINGSGEHHVILERAITPLFDKKVHIKWNLYICDSVIVKMEITARSIFNLIVVIDFISVTQQTMT